ncbi:MAG: DMT family transporter [Phycisphaerales bacterium]|nr:DMT family transporter [Phycisphaerales bacterium]
MLAAGFLFALMGALVKLGARDFSFAELAFYRSAFGLLVLLPGIMFGQKRLRTPYWRWHLSRGLLGTTGLFLYFFAISTLPLATAVTLNYTAPLFLTVLSLLTLRVRPNLLLIGGIVLGFIGVVFLLQPTLDSQLLVPALLGLAGGLCSGLAFFSTRELGQRGEPPWRVVFYFSVVSTVVASGWLLWHGMHAPSLASIPALLGIGICATLAQLAMTRAYKDGHVLIVGSLSYSTVAFTSLLGILLWHEWLVSEEWLGLGLIVASGVIATLGSNRSILPKSNNERTAS